MLPKFSIVIPCYNEDQFIGRLLDSIANQKYFLENIEIVIVDNNCTDKTVEVVKKYSKYGPLMGKIHIVKEKNRGMNYARSAGVRVTKGQYLVILDADNYVESNFLSQIDSLISDGYLAACFYTLGDKESNIIDHAVYFILHGIKRVIKRPFGKCFAEKKLLDVYNIQFDTSIKLGTMLRFNLLLKKNAKAKYKITNIKVYTSSRRFHKKGYISILSRWLRGYLSGGFR